MFACQETKTLIIWKGTGEEFRARPNLYAIDELHRLVTRLLKYSDAHENYGSPSNESGHWRS